MDDFLFLIGLGLLFAIPIIATGYFIHGTPIIVIGRKKKDREGE